MSRKTWRLRALGADLVLVRRSDVTEAERARVTPASVACAGIDGWVSEAPARASLIDLLQTVSGTTPARSALKARVEEVLRRGDVVALRGERRRMVVSVKLPEITPPLGGSEPEVYELAVEVRCKDTGHPLPRTPLVVYDQQKRVVYRGTTDTKGKRMVPVEIQGNYEVVVFPRELERVSLHVVDPNGSPLVATNVKLEDSAGKTYELVTNDDGIARAEDVSGGAAKLTIDGKTIAHYLDPFHGEHHVVKVQGRFAERARDEFSTFEDGRGA